VQVKLSNTKSLSRIAISATPRSLPAVLSSSARNVLQRPYCSGEVVSVRKGFRLHKERCGRQLEVICHLQTHQFGWEVVLTVNSSLQRSQVCRSQDEVLDTTERWRAAMIDKGWWV
jgi:hypothetical protein